MIILLGYLGRLAFQGFVLAGTAWLITYEQWNPWWMAAALIFCSGSFTATEGSKTGEG